MRSNLYGNLIIVDRLPKIISHNSTDFFQHGGPTGRSMRSKRDLLQGISLFVFYFSFEMKKIIFNEHDTAFYLSKEEKM